ncbi:MAG: NAD(P)-dependent oxidoreductase [bacterium]
MAEILITGGAGNMGRSLAGALRGQGHGLRILDLPACDFGFFDGWERTSVFPGDILDRGFLRNALRGVDWVYHLAAILPPASEANRERTFRVNVEGTRSLIEAASSGAAPSRPPTVVLASSVSVFGDTTSHEGLVASGHPVAPNDLYAASKVEAEAVLMKSGLPFVNLRISAVVIPAFLDPPEPWPFTRGQRIELVPLADLVRAMANLAGKEGAVRRTLILAGGPEWRIRGEDYVRRWGEVMDIPLEEMSFMERPGWLSWYDTRESQVLLDYQKTSLDAFLAQLAAAVAEALA